MKKLFIAAGAVALAITGYCKTVAKVLVTGCKTDNVDLYEVDDSDNWTRVKEFCNPAKAAFGVICYNGVVYVATASNADTDAGVVERYDLAGNRLTPLPDCAFGPRNLKVSPDGKYLFVGGGAGGTASDVKGNIYRYPLASGTAGTWELFSHFAGKSCMRSVEIDPNGNVFFADRASAYYVGDCNAESASLPYTDMSNSVYGGFICGLRYNPADGKLYLGNAKGSGYSAYGKVTFDNETKKFGAVEWSRKSPIVGWNDDLLIVNGQVYMSALNGGNGIFRVGFAAEDPEDVMVSTNDGAYYGMDLYFVSPSETFGFEKAYCGECTAGAKTLWPQGGAIAGAANGISGNCLYFKEAGATAKFVDSEAMLPATGDFAMSMWFGLPEGNTERLLFSNRNPLLATNELSVVVDVNGKLGLVFNGHDPIVSTLKVDDGEWHQVGLVRRGGTALELYGDGELLGSIAIAANEAVTLKRGFHLGCNDYEDEGFLGAGAFIDELSFYTAAPGESDFYTEYAAHAGTAVPTAAPTAPIAEAMPEVAGVEIAHAFAADKSFGAPTIVVIGNTYYVGVGVGEAAHAGAQSLRVYQSVNGGESWEIHSTLAAAGASLFVSADALCAIGMPTSGSAAENAATACVWKFGDSGWQLAASQALGEGRFDMLSAQVALAQNNSSVWKSVVKRTYKPSDAIFEYGTYNLAFGLGDGITFKHFKGGDNIFVNSFGGYMPVGDVLGGVAVPRLGQTLDSWGVQYFWPMVGEKRAAYDSVEVGMERCMQSASSWDGTIGAATPDMFRGGSRPFGIFYDDDASQRYYAVTVAGTSSAELQGVKSQLDVDHTLAVYMSKDFRAWYPTGVLSELGADSEIGYNGAACVRDGDDLLVVTMVAADDGAPGFNKRRTNYLAFRKVENYRAAFEAATKAPATNERVIFTDREGTGSIFGYYRGQDGEWFPAGEPIDLTQQFVDPNDGATLRVNSLQNVIQRGNRLYASTGETTAKPARVYEFSLKGKLRRAFCEPTKGFTILNLDISDDRTYAVVAATPGVYKVDFADNTWTQIIANNDGHIGSVRSVQVAANGDVYVGIWAVKTIGHYTPGEPGEPYKWVKNISQPSGDSFVTGLVLDEANDALYSSDIRGRVFKTKLSTGETTVLSSWNVSGLHTAANCLGLDKVNGRIYTTARAGINHAVDLTTGETTFPFAHLKSTSGSCYIEDITILGDKGTLLFVK